MVAMATRMTSNGSRMNNSTTVDNPCMGRRGRGGGGGRGGEGREERREKRVQIKNKNGNHRDHFKGKKRISLWSGIIIILTTLCRNHGNTTGPISGHTQQCFSRLFSRLLVSGRWHKG